MNATPEPLPPPGAANFTGGFVEAAAYHAAVDKLKLREETITSIKEIIITAHPSPQGAAKALDRIITLLDIKP